MDVNKIKEETAQILEVDLTDVNYITQDFINQHLLKSKSLFENDDLKDKKSEELEDLIKNGNSIWVDEYRYHWSQNADGTPDSECGADQPWSVGKLRVRSVKKKGKCKDGKKWYQLKIIMFN